MYYNGNTYGYFESYSDFYLFTYIGLYAFIKSKYESYSKIDTIMIVLSVYLLISWIIRKLIYFGGVWGERIPYYHTFHPLFFLKIFDIHSAVDTEEVKEEDIRGKCVLPTVRNSTSEIPQIFNLLDTYQITCNEGHNGGGLYTCLDEDNYKIKFPEKTADWFTPEDNTLHLVNENGDILKNHNLLDENKDNACYKGYQKISCAPKIDGNDICKKGADCSTFTNKSNCEEAGCNFREARNPYCPQMPLNVCENSSETTLGNICSEDSNISHLPDNEGQWILTIIIHVIIILFFWKILIPWSKNHKYGRIVVWLSYILPPIIFYFWLVIVPHLVSLNLNDGGCPDKYEKCTEQGDLGSETACNNIDALCVYDGTKCVPKCEANPFAVLSEVLVGHDKKWDKAGLIAEKIWKITTTTAPWLLIALVIVVWICRVKGWSKRILAILFVLILLIPLFVWIETSTANVCVKRLVTAYARSPTLLKCWLSAFGGWIPPLISWIIIIVMIIISDSKTTS